jgi:hypothetical protein
VSRFANHASLAAIAPVMSDLSVRLAGLFPLFVKGLRCGVTNSMIARLVVKLFASRAVK